MKFMEESTNQVTEGPIREFILFSTGNGEPLKVFKRAIAYLHYLYRFLQQCCGRHGGRG